MSMEVAGSTGGGRRCVEKWRHCVRCGSFRRGKAFGGRRGDKICHGGFGFCLAEFGDCCSGWLGGRPLFVLARQIAVARSLVGMTGVVIEAFQSTAADGGFGESARPRVQRSEALI